MRADWSNSSSQGCADRTDRAVRPWSNVASEQEGHPSVNLGIVAQAAGLFAVTNVDDILVLSLFFAQGAGHHGSARRITFGQYVGFAAILAVAVAAAFGATFLPESAIPYLGLLPLTLGLKSAWQAWQHR